jgi:hypothetical protein
MAIADMKIKDVPSIMNQIAFMEVKLKCMSYFYFVLHTQAVQKAILLKLLYWSWFWYYSACFLFGIQESGTLLPGYNFNKGYGTNLGDLSGGGLSVFPAVMSTGTPE